MVKKKFFISVSFIFFMNLCFAKIPSVFFDIGYGSRPQAMGGAFVACDNDVNVIIWNPAALTTMQKKEITIMGTKQLGLVPYVFLGFATFLSPLPLKENNKEKSINNLKKGIGVGLINSGDDVLKESILIFSYGQAIEKYLKFIKFSDIEINGGINFKLRTVEVGKNEGGGENKITGLGVGMGFDFALFSRYNNFSVGILLRDLISPLFCNSNVSNSYVEFVPLTISYGIKYNFKEDILCSVQKDGLARTSFGIETKFYKLFALRLGLRLLNQTNSFTTEYTTGCGFFYPVNEKKNMIINLNLAYEINNLLANTFKVDTIFSF